MKVILLGDSITQGLGSKKINFSEELNRLLGEDATVLNYAKTGTTIDYVNTLMEAIAEASPDYAVLVYGNVDAQVRPCTTGKAIRRIPKRYREANISPRPFYSHHLFRALNEHIDNVFRTVCRKYVLWCDGTEQWVPFEQYKEAFDAVCRRIVDAGVIPVVCSTVYIDDAVFRGSQTEYEKYNAFMKAYAQKHHFSYVDFYTEFQQLVTKEGWEAYYNKDHFHPNKNGYRVMAAKISSALR